MQPNPDAIKFDDDGAPQRHGAGGRADQFYNFYLEHRSGEREEFRFVIKTLHILIGKEIPCRVAVEHNSHPLPPQTNGDLCWGDVDAGGRIHQTVCRLALLWGNRKSIPTEPDLKPAQIPFAAYAKRLIFPGRLYNRKENKPYFIHSSRQSVLDIPPDDYFVPDIEEMYPINSPESFADHVKKWVDSDKLRGEVSGILGRGAG